MAMQPRAVRLSQSRPRTGIDGLRINVIKPRGVPPEPLEMVTVAGDVLPGMHTRAYSFQFEATGGSDDYVWDVSVGSLPSGLSLDADTGVVSGTMGTTGNTSFTIRVTSGAETATLAVTITSVINLGQPGTLADAINGTAYSDSASASVGYPALSYAVTSGSLPTGLSLNASSGLVSGTPTVNDTYNFTITVTDTEGFTNSRSYTMLVSYGVLDITTVDADVPNGTVGVVYNTSGFQFSAVLGQAPRTWDIAAGALASGLSLSSSGLLSGTPTTEETANFTVRVTSNDSQTDTLAVSMDIAAAPSSSLVSFQKGEEVISSSTAGTFDVTISSVDTSKAVLLFTHTCTNGASYAALLTGYILNSTTIRFVRNNTGSNSFKISWYVIERSDWTVTNYNYISTDFTAGTNNDKTITSVDTSIAFPVLGCHLASATQGSTAARIARSSIAVEITSATNLRLKMTTPTGLPTDVRVQIVQWTGATVRKVPITNVVADGTTNYTVSLSGSVTAIANTMLLATQAHADASNTIGADFIGFQLVGTSTVRVWRNTTAEDANSVYCVYAIYHPSLSVQRGQISFPGSASSLATVNFTITSVDTTKTSTMCWPRTNETTSSTFPAWLCCSYLTSATNLRIENYNSCTYLQAEWEAVTWS